jgi:hypothetical protein
MRSPAAFLDNHASENSIGILDESQVQIVFDGVVKPADIGLKIRSTFLWLAVRR